jgi:hypothetical protein
MPFKNPHPLYSVWQGMLRRCDNPRIKQWLDYGGRGIDVCDRWKEKPNGFSNFIADMGPRPTKYTLDRIDNNQGYKPENCCWASKKDQQRNRRVTIKVVIEGREYIAAELAEIVGMKTDTIVVRAQLGLTLEQVLNPTKRVYREGLAIGHKFGRGASRHRLEP